MFLVVKFVWVLWSTCCYYCPWSTLVHCLFSLLTTYCNGSLDIHLLLFQALVISRWKHLHIHRDQPKGWVIKLKLLSSTCLIWISHLYKVNLVGWSWNNKQCLVLLKMVSVCGYFSMVGLRLLQNNVTIGANSAIIMGQVLFYLPQGTNFLQLKILSSEALLCRWNQAHQYSYLTLKAENNNQLVQFR